MIDDKRRGPPTHDSCRKLLFAALGMAALLCVVVVDVGMRIRL